MPNKVKRVRPEGYTESRWVYNLWVVHRMRQSDYELLWETQDGKCYLCGDYLTRGKLTHIDHDHSCNKHLPSQKTCELCRRGLACQHCNTLVGLSFDNPERLRIIADNLEQAQKRVK